MHSTIKYGKRSTNLVLLTFCKMRWFDPIKFGIPHS